MEEDKRMYCISVIENLPYGMMTQKHDRLSKSYLKGILCQ